MRLLIANIITNITPPPHSTMILPVVTTMKYIKEDKQSKTKIGVGSSMTENVVEVGEDIRKVESRSVRNEVVVFV